MIAASTPYLANSLAEGMYKTISLVWHIKDLYCFLILYSSEVHQQIDFIVHTREMYSVCEITSAGFCDGVCSRDIHSGYCSMK